LIKKDILQREKRQTIINYLANLLLLLFYRLNNHARFDVVLGRKNGKMMNSVCMGKGNALCQDPNALNIFMTVVMMISLSV